MVVVSILPVLQSNAVWHWVHHIWLHPSILKIFVLQLGHGFVSLTISSAVATFSWSQVCSSSVASPSSLEITTSWHFEHVVFSQIPHFQLVFKNPLHSGSEQPLIKTAVCWGCLLVYSVFLKMICCWLPPRLN